MSVDELKQKIADLTRQMEQTAMGLNYLKGQKDAYESMLKVLTEKADGAA